MAALTDTARRRAVVGGAVAVVLALALVVVLLTAGGRQDPAAEPAPSAPTSSPTSTSAPTEVAAADGCDPAPASDQLPTAPPDDLEFEVVNRGIVPVSDTYGPTMRTDPVWDCFSRSPMGAVMAAASISVHRVVGEDLVAIGEQQLVENEGQQVYLDFARSQEGGSDAPAGGFNQAVGFRVDSYTPNQAVVSLAYRTPDGALSSAALTVLWQDDTWKLQLFDDGSETSALTALPDLDDYTTWGL
ncbi:hypothetical protein [uncultured Pseudokineococcus sp.]|uniref:hypothetical protein n=1 Tax=uncultured Pseudokineococcus sp. TaxID=1642928 RepID=UPI002605E4F1|nr:hypothetical protein [uncultured Pseudokineococcus sp.]